MSCPVAFIFSSLGAGEVLLVLAVALLLFGAERLPSMARSLGQALHELRRSAGDLTRCMLDDSVSASSGRDSSNKLEQKTIEEKRREG